mmetsp:Transcript_17804/g.41995  ORF Transcript_17804/g.41995 Transcript_17804/m.41995 type:complete len:191 (-) Transcript_17804:109-681(-)
MTVSPFSSVLLSCLAAAMMSLGTEAFTPTTINQPLHRLAATPVEGEAASSMQSFDDEDEASPATTVPAGMNPDRPELPELKGDFDWDAKFAQDEDWITENVPGKIVLNEIELAAQVTALTQLEDSWRKEAALEEWEASKQVGFVSKAEIINGRTAMFFLVTGLLTEYWTGISMPGQVEEMLRIAGVIGFD